MGPSSLAYVFYCLVNEKGKNKQTKEEEKNVSIFGQITQASMCWRIKLTQFVGSDSAILLASVPLEVGACVAFVAQPEDRLRSRTRPTIAALLTLLDPSRVERKT